MRKSNQLILSFCLSILLLASSPTLAVNAQPGQAGTSAVQLSVTETKAVISDTSTTFELPVFGKIDASQISLPVLAIILGGLDGFNPCAFFVLLMLLSLMVHAKSRKKIMLIGGVFVFFSGCIYFLFMAAWLNLFLLLGNLRWITILAGFISIVLAIINIKEYFYFGQGISLMIPQSKKNQLFELMRSLLKSSSLIAVLLGTIVLAIVANTFELLCTAGLPMIFTRILSLHSLPLFLNYLYLLLYNIIYVVPLLVIVSIFTITLGSKKLSEPQGRVLKLISGIMMLGLGGVLFIRPPLLNNLVFFMGLFITMGILALLIIFISNVFINRQYLQPMSKGRDYAKRSVLMVERISRKNKSRRKPNRRHTPNGSK